MYLLKFKGELRLKRKSVSLSDTTIGGRGGGTQGVQRYIDIMNNKCPARVKSQ